MILHVWVVPARVLQKGAGIVGENGKNVVGSEVHSSTLPREHGGRLRCTCHLMQAWLNKVAILVAMAMLSARRGW